MYGSKLSMLQISTPAWGSMTPITLFGFASSVTYFHRGMEKRLMVFFVYWTLSPSNVNWHVASLGISDRWIVIVSVRSVSALHRPHNTGKDSELILFYQKISRNTFTHLIHQIG